MGRGKSWIKVCSFVIKSLYCLVVNEGTMSEIPPSPVIAVHHQLSCGQGVNHWKSGTSSMLIYALTNKQILDVDDSRSLSYAEV